MSAPDLPEPRDHLTSPRTRSALRVQATALEALRDELREAGFVELTAPVIGPVTDPGTRGSKQVDVDFYGERYKLMASAILYKQASLLSFDKIFYLAPNIRLEPPPTATTGRHLVEFHQLDVEIAGATWRDAAALLERLVKRATAHVIAHALDDLERLGRHPGDFAELLDADFDHVSHAEVVETLVDHGHPQSATAEIDWSGEEIIARKIGRPTFVVEYPKGSRGFYDREDPERPGVLRNFDLLAPGGFGEISSGGEREHEYARLVTRMRETGENPAKYRWYLDLAREVGLPASAGFGLGLERFVRYLGGLDAVWQASAFPKLAGRFTP